MFQSVSGHRWTSMQRTWFTTVHGQLYRSYKESPICQTDLRITNYRRHKFPPSLTLLSFKTRNEWPSVLTATASFPSVFFQLLQYSRQHPSFSAHRAALITKATFIFSSIFLSRLGISQFNCAFAVSFHFTPFKFWTNHNSLLRIATNEMASCIDNRLRQMAFFIFTKVGKGRLSSNDKRF